MECKHTEVTIISKLARIATLITPEEWDYIAICDECGQQMDIMDIPEDAEIHEK